MGLSQFVLGICSSSLVLLLVFAGLWAIFATLGMFLLISFRSGFSHRQGGFLLKLLGALIMIVWAVAELSLIAGLVLMCYWLLS
jgi:hypothetical protein